MAKISKLKGKGTPPTNEVTDNLRKGSDLVNINFKVDPQLKEQMRRYAFEHNISYTDLFVNAVTEYMRK